MESFATHGRFWLPQRPERPRRMVHGRLTFNEDGVRLDLDDPLWASEVRPGGTVGGSPEPGTEPVVHGRLRDGRDVTLLGLSGWRMPADGIQECWSADFALTGGFTSDDTVRQLVVIFDYLMPWVRPPGITRGEFSSFSFTVETQQMTLAETSLSDGRTIRLVTGVYGRRADDSVHLNQWCGLEVTGPEPTPVREVLEEWVRPLQDLLVVCIGQPVRIEQVLVGSPERDAGPPPTPQQLLDQIMAGTPERDRRTAPLELLFKAVQPAASAHVATARLDGDDSPALLSYAASPLPFSTLIGGWFSLYDRLPDDVVTLLCGPYYAPFIYSRHRYASTFQSAEALARKVYGAREKDRTEHGARVERVTAALRKAQLGEELGEEDTGWAMRVLQGRNDKPLSQLMEELISSAGDMGRELLAAIPDLPGKLAGTRTSVSHGGAKGPDAAARYWLGEALIWVLRVRLLAELGVPVSDLSARVTQKPAFQEVLRELGRLWPSADEAEKGLSGGVPWRGFGIDQRVDRVAQLPAIAPPPWSSLGRPARHSARGGEDTRN